MRLSEVAASPPLQVPFGTRFVKGTKKLVKYALEHAVDGREEWVEAATEAAKPKKELAAGDQVLCRGQIALLSVYDEVPGAQDGPCSVTFGAEGSEIEKTVNYSSRFGNSSKSARLQRPPALLLPPDRKDRKDKLSDEVKEHVKLFYESSCPTSPHQRDRMRRLLATRVWDPQQAMIQTA